MKKKKNTSEDEEMLDHYDFSKAKPGKWAKELKVVKTIRFDLEIIQWLEAEGAKHGMGYQTFLNWFLRQSMRKEGSIEERLRRLEKAVFKKS